jgi:hypothetical protein
VWFVSFVVSLFDRFAQTAGKTWVPAFAGMSGVEIGRLELTPP